MNDRELTDAELESVSGGLGKSSSAATTRQKPVRTTSVGTFAPASGFAASTPAPAPSAGGGNCVGGVCRI